MPRQRPAKLLGLSEPRLVWALGIAATQAAGLREMFGTMCKPLHPGMAAKNGLYAALLAQQDFTSTNVGIEGKRGFANVLAAERDYEAITERLGETWELAENTYKPFACGIVIHPTIDGCIQLRNEHRLQPEDIERIDVAVHPLVLELTGKKTPAVGLEGKFSVYHCASVAVIDGVVGEAQFSDERVVDPRVTRCATACAPPSIRPCTRTPPTSASRCATERCCPGASSTRSAASPGR